MSTTGLAVLILAAGAGGCTNPDGPASAGPDTPPRAEQNAGEPAAPPPLSSSRQRAADIQRTPEAALAAFAQLYINWSYQTVSSRQQTLAGISVGSARLAEQQAAAASAGDGTIRQGHIHNSGQVIAIGADSAHRGLWAIVTREQTGGENEYEGLRAAYHVTLARLSHLAGGYAVSEWLPQS